MIHYTLTHKGRSHVAWIKVPEIYGGFRQQKCKANRMGQNGIIFLLNWSIKTCAKEHQYIEEKNYSSKQISSVRQQYFVLYLNSWLEIIQGMVK